MAKVTDNNCQNSFSVHEGDHMSCKWGSWWNLERIQQQHGKQKPPAMNRFNQFGLILNLCIPFKASSLTTRFWVDQDKFQRRKYMQNYKSCFISSKGMRITSDQRQRPEQVRAEANASIHLVTYHGRRNYNAISYGDSLKLNAHIITTYFKKLPQIGQSGCPIEAVRAVWKSVGHRCRGADACPGHGNPHSCVLQSNYDPTRRWFRTVRQQRMRRCSYCSLFLLEAPVALASNTTTLPWLQITTNLCDWELLYYFETVLRCLCQWSTCSLSFPFHYIICIYAKLIVFLRIF